MSSIRGHIAAASVKKYRLMCSEILASWCRAVSLFGVLALLVSGCATRSHQVLATGSRPGVPPDGYGTLILYAPQKRFEGGATVLIDDVPVFKLHAQDYSWVYLRGGEHTLRTLWGHGLDNLRSNGHVRVAAGTACDLKLIQWYDAAISFADVHAGIRTVTEDSARSELAGLTFCPPLAGQVTFPPR